MLPYYISDTETSNLGLVIAHLMWQVYNFIIHSHARHIYISGLYHPHTGIAIQTKLS